MATVRLMGSVSLLLTAQVLPFRNYRNADLFSRFEVAEGRALAVGDEPVGF